MMVSEQANGLVAGWGGTHFTPGRKKEAGEMVCEAENPPQPLKHATAIPSPVAIANLLLKTMNPL
jgi:hypothetical protein